MEPIETRYTGPSDTCIYWEIFKKPDGISGYNDWKLIKLKPKDKVYKEEDDIAQLKISTHHIGVRMVDQVKVGGFVGTLQMTISMIITYSSALTRHQWPSKISCFSWMVMNLS